MKVLKIALVMAAAALTTTPAWALPGHAPSNSGTEHAPATVPVGPPSTTPNNTSNPGSANRSGSGDENSGGGERGAAHNNSSHNNSSGGGSNHGHSGQPSHPGQSHRCMPHNVAYIAAGTLLNQTLSKDGTESTYSGELEVAVAHTNHHAAADRKTTKTYNVEHVHITFALADVNNDGSVGLDDVQANDRVKLIGKISSLAKRCDRSGFTAKLTIARIVLHPPAGSRG